MARSFAAATFSAFSGSSRYNIARLGSNGVLESTSTFVGQEYGAVYSIALRGDGKIHVGSVFGLDRLVNSTATTTLTAPSSSFVQWMRSGACGEISNATFELSSDGGNTWDLLGGGTRISGGWQLTGLNLPASGYLRGRGQATAGAGNGAVSLIEQMIPLGGASLAPVANTLPAKPTASTGSIGSTQIIYGAVLNGSVNALGNNTTVTFQYGLTSNYGSSVTAIQSPVTGSNLTPVSASLTLSPNTTYHYRVQATSSAGTTYGSDTAFTTFNNVTTLSDFGVDGAILSPPFSSFAAQYESYNAVLPPNATTTTINIAATDPNATISVNGNVLPSGATSVVVNVAPGNNSIPIVVTAQDGITQTSYDLTVTVTTLPTAATAHTDVADTYATLKASVQAMDTTASVTFQYGLDTNYGITVAGPNASGGFKSILGATVTGLLPGTTYHYRVIVTNSQGTAASNDAAFTTSLMVPPGSIDNTFNANASDILATAIQPDGRIVAGGFFTQVNGIAAGNIARFNPDGSLDTSFTATTNAPVECVAVQNDGRILIGGYFTKVNGAAVKNLARLNADGSLDTSFVASPDNEIVSIALQRDGRILIGGFFRNLGATAQKFLARLNADGSIDNGFAPVIDLWVNSIALQDDGKIVVGGWFSTVNGTAHDSVVRLYADGTTDSDFNAGTDYPVDCVVVQPDGSVVLTGWFSKVNGITRHNVARVAADGTLDPNFDPNTDQEVVTAALQADGKILIGGYFNQVGTAARNRIARFNADGTLDAAFDPDANGWVYSVTPLANGELLVGGDFTTLFGQPHRGLALLVNDPAAWTFSVPDLTQIQWTRSGAGPEITGVTFDLSTDGGATWNALGNGTRNGMSWQLTGLSLPPNGLIRARGRASGGEDGGSSSLLEQDFSYPLSVVPAPQILIQGPAGGAISSGGSTVNFGTLLPGSTASQTFTVFNTGNADLTNLAIAIDGANAADFVVTHAPASVVGSGGSATFAVRFTPTAAGPRSATLHLASNAASNNPFNINLTGTGLTYQENWRQTWFGNASATGSAADTADPDGDGVPNLVEFAIGSDPTHATKAPGQIVHNGGNLEFTYQRADAAITDGISFNVEWSDSLLPNSWNSSGVSETILSDNGTIQQVKATLPDGGRGQRFIRLRVTH